jgi:hypothetical protein
MCDDGRRKWCVREAAGGGGEGGGIQNPRTPHKDVGNKSFSAWNLTSEMKAACLFRKLSSLGFSAEKPRNYEKLRKNTWINLRVLVSWSAAFSAVALAQPSVVLLSGLPPVRCIRNRQVQCFMSS